MPMQMVNLLPALGTSVGHQPKTPLRVGVHTLLQGKLGGQQQHTPQKVLVLRAHLRHGGDVQFGDQQKMHWRPRVDIVEGENLFVFVNLFARYLAGNDFAKDAVGVGVHGGI
jgi:hypothetical protein